MITAASRKSQYSEHYRCYPLIAAKKYFFIYTS